MDPTACALNIISDYHSGNFEDAKEGLQNLDEWIDKGGFMPDIDSEGWQVIRMVKKLA